MTALISALMIALAVRYFWDLRNRVWFWIAIIFIASLHVLLILLLPAPAKQWNYIHWNYVQLLPFGLLDFAIAYGIIRLVEKVADRGS